MSITDGTYRLGGLRFIVSNALPQVPKLKISPECPCSPEFRADMDAWLVERFGYTDTAFIFDSKVAGRMTAILNSRMEAEIRRIFQGSGA